MSQRDIEVYDANEVNMVVDGIVLTGWGEGDFIECEKEEDMVKKHVSAKGDVGVAITHHGTGKITAKLAQTSSVYEDLMKIARARKMVSVWVISNNAVKEKIGGTQAQIIKYPKASFGGEIGTRDFVFDVYDYEQ